jgi:hypothetical protein
MPTAFIATQGAANYPVPKPIGGGVTFLCWGTYNATAALTVNDTVAICRIPANSYVFDGVLRADDIDTGTGVMELDVGIAANGVDTADPVAFLDSGALNGTALTNYFPVAGIRIPFTGLVQPRLFTVETIVMVKVTAAPNAGGTGRLTVYVHLFNA